MSFWTSYKSGAWCRTGWVSNWESLYYAVWKLSFVDELWKNMLRSSMSLYKKKILLHFSLIPLLHFFGDSISLGNWVVRRFPANESAAYGLRFFFRPPWTQNCKIWRSILISFKSRVMLLRAEPLSFFPPWLVTPSRLVVGVADFSRSRVLREKNRVVENCRLEKSRTIRRRKRRK